MPARNTAAGMRKWLSVSTVHMCDRCFICPSLLLDLRWPHHNDAAQAVSRPPRNRHASNTLQIRDKLDVFESAGGEQFADGVALVMADLEHDVTAPEQS